MNKENKHIIVFDLDDTLYQEIDFLKSAYKEIAKHVSLLTRVNDSDIFIKMMSDYHAGTNVFENLILRFNLDQDVQFFLNMYRNHKPNISITVEKKEALDRLRSCNYVLGLLTDGRSVQQRNKIDALNIESYFSEIVISEEFGSSKPNMQNYKHFQKVFPNCNYTYIADNVSKDFVSANALNWTTICLLDSGENIHKQDFSLPEPFLPKYKITSFNEILVLIDQ